MTLRSWLFFGLRVLWFFSLLIGGGRSNWTFAVGFGAPVSSMSSMSSSTTSQTGGEKWAVIYNSGDPFNASIENSLKAMVEREEQFYRQFGYQVHTLGPDRGERPNKENFEKVFHKLSSSGINIKNLEIVFLGHGEVEFPHHWDLPPERFKAFKIPFYPSGRDLSFHSRPFAIMGQPEVVEREEKGNIGKELFLHGVSASDIHGNLEKLFKAHPEVEVSLYGQPCFAGCLGLSLNQLDQQLPNARLQVFASCGANETNRSTNTHNFGEFLFFLRDQLHPQRSYHEAYGLALQEYLLNMRSQQFLSLEKKLTLPISPLEQTVANWCVKRAEEEKLEEKIDGRASCSSSFHLSESDLGVPEIGAGIEATEFTMRKKIQNILQDGFTQKENHLLFLAQRNSCLGHSLIEETFRDPRSWQVNLKKEIEDIRDLQENFQDLKKQVFDKIYDHLSEFNVLPRSHFSDFIQADEMRWEEERAEVLVHPKFREFRREWNRFEELREKIDEEEAGIFSPMIQNKFISLLDLYLDLTLKTYETKVGFHPGLKRSEGVIRRRANSFPLRNFKSELRGKITLIEEILQKVRPNTGAPAAEELIDLAAHLFDTRSLQDKGGGLPFYPDFDLPFNEEFPLRKSSCSQIIQKLWELEKDKECQASFQAEAKSHDLLRIQKTYWMGERKFGE